ncbi:MAG: hypothetical protein Q9M14_08530 [Mariprofundaceae bacterium]|nr:hypothetical protein [Mariprofundaceae bacterium]
MRVARVDINQAEIVAALRQVGATVQHLHGVGQGCPDLLIGFRSENYLIEVKTKSKASKLNALQERWHSDWRGSVNVARCVDDALTIIGAI